MEWKSGRLKGEAALKEEQKKKIKQMVIDRGLTEVKDQF